MSLYNPAGDFDSSGDVTADDIRASLAGEPQENLTADWVVLDVREQVEWDHGHAPDAVHIPLSELPERIDELPEAELVVVCRSGGRSARATQWLNHAGFEARNLDGGMKAWWAAGLPLQAAQGVEPSVW
ncbi:MAG TPA: rhodanese-like domain-containing protein [Actinomycetaceae bacterium]|nr:rhodanese-like domain-containing protein [Actinomycetaceae bacterium]